MEIKVNKGIYSRQVLLKTAYAFSDRVYLHLSQDDSNWVVEWTNMPGQKIVPEMFENELVSQQLREDLVERTKDLRMLLLTRAFASSVIETDHNETNKSSAIMNDDSIDEKDEMILGSWFDQ